MNSEFCFETFARQGLALCFAGRKRQCPASKTKLTGERGGGCDDYAGKYLNPNTTDYMFAVKLLQRSQLQKSSWKFGLVVAGYLFQTPGPLISLLFQAEECLVDSTDTNYLTPGCFCHLTFQWSVYCTTMVLLTFSSKPKARSSQSWYRNAGRHISKFCSVGLELFQFVCPM